MKSLICCDITSCIRQATSYWVYLDPDTGAHLFSRCAKHGMVYNNLSRWSVHTTYKAAQLHITKESL